MKNKNIAIGAGALVAIVVLIVFIALLSHKVEVTKHRSYGVSKSACKLFPFTYAHALMGNSTHLATDKTVALGNIKVSTCAYEQSGSLAPVKEQRLSSTLVAQVPQNLEGRDKLKEDFKTQMGKNTKIKVYGDMDYWDNTNGQLNVYKNDTWYTLTYGLPNAEQRSLSQTEEQIDLIAARF